MKSNKEAVDDHKGKVKKRPGDEIMGHTTNKEWLSHKKIKTTGHCSDSQFFIAMLLKQASGIFGKFNVDGGVLKGNLTDGCQVIRAKESIAHVCNLLVALGAPTPFTYVIK
jgi:hypothetical protein